MILFIGTNGTIGFELFLNNSHPLPLMVLLDDLVSFSGNLFQCDKLAPSLPDLHHFRVWEIPSIIHLRTDHYMHANKLTEAGETNIKQH